MRSKQWIVFLYVVLLYYLILYLLHEETSPIDQLNYLSDEALQLTKSHRYEDAKIILEAFSDKFSSVTVKEQSFTMDELRIVTIAHNEAVEATTNATMNPDERINRVTKFRLVIDAISATKNLFGQRWKSQLWQLLMQVKRSCIKWRYRSIFMQNFNSFLSLI